jgi:HPt (histidine-containing phosphotransfer) domain-containing protein
MIMNLASALQEAHIDLATIAQVRQLESIRPGVLAQLVGVFQRTASASLARIRDSVQAGEGEQLRLTLHSLKGTAASLGAKRLSAIAGAFEIEVQDLASSGSSAPLNELIDALEQEFDLVFPQLLELANQ